MISASPAPADREQLRLSLLRHLAENPTRWGYNLALLRQLLAAEGHPRLSAETIEAELLYLADKGLVAPVEKLLSPELKAWRITAAGRDVLAETQGV